MSEDSSLRSMPVAWLAVVCTGQRTHQRTRLCDVRFSEDGTWYATECGSQSDDDTVRSWEVFRPDDKPDAWIYDFFCRRCGRNTRIARHNWLKLMVGLAPATWTDGEVTRDLDISLLPF